MSEEFDRAYWEERYRGRTAGCGGPPNSHLVAEVEGLAPGRALDAGCGEGANAVWLASHGWQVTAVDVASAALDRARERAERPGVGVAGRIEWFQADLGTWTPPTEHFALVTAHYVHPASAYEALMRRLAQAVAPGGTLFVVDHAPTRHSGAAHGPVPHVHHTAQDAAADLEPGQWDIAVAETRTRTVSGHDGHETILHDAVLRARKRP